MVCPPREIRFPLRNWPGISPSGHCPDVPYTSPGRPHPQSSPVHHLWRPGKIKLVFSLWSLRTSLFKIKVNTTHKQAFFFPLLKIRHVLWGMLLND